MTVTSPLQTISGNPGIDEAVVRAKLLEELRKYAPRSVTLAMDEPRPGSTNHPADCASYAEAAFTEEAIRMQLVGIGAKVLHQLKKLDQGTYGVCDAGLDHPIERDRLEACIYAATCIAHMRAASTKH